MSKGSDAEVLEINCVNWYILWSPNFKAFLSLKREVTLLDVNGDENTEEIIVKDKYNFFVIDAMATIGTRIKFNPNYGIFAMIEGRRQLTNNYDEQGPYIRKPYALGFNFGIQIYL